jgi:hypothetical protein
LYPSDGILYDDSPTSPWPLDSDNINAVWICYLDKYAMDALKDTVTWSILYWYATLKPDGEEAGHRLRVKTQDPIDGVPQYCEHSDGTWNDKHPKEALVIMQDDALGGPGASTVGG